MADKLWLVWLIAAVIFLVLELATVSMVSLWFVAGSLIAMTAALLGAGTALQILLMLLSSILFLLIFLALRKKMGIMPAQRKPTNADRMIGMEAVVIKDVDPLRNSGQVQVDGQIWSARTEADEPIPKGSKVKVKGLRGVKLVVERS